TIPPRTNPTPTPPTPHSVLKFWFALERPGKKDDEAVREALGGAYELAAGHKLDGWIAAPRERLALILLLDQVPRHLYRADARAYATDLKAQGLTARFFHGEGADVGDLSLEETYFAALPWLHAEDAALQQAVNPIMRRCAEGIPRLAFMEGNAEMYLETIRRFGRFPHRNAMRGIESTPQEARFLEEVWFPEKRRLRKMAGIPPDG
ncbi:MAG: DUF924 domain-containing protein, partial [SAR324 cluster bacterium]|nr:DUF924 domain-containing protein [SAR324 cluster bacterium]